MTENRNTKPWMTLTVSHEKKKLVLKFGCSDRDQFQLMLDVFKRTLSPIDRWYDPEVKEWHIEPVARPLLKPWIDRFFEPAHIRVKITAADLSEMKSWPRQAYGPPIMSTTRPPIPNRTRSVSNPDDLMSREQRYQQQVMDLTGQLSILSRDKLLVEADLRDQRRIVADLTDRIARQKDAVRHQAEELVKALLEIARLRREIEEGTAYRVYEFRSETRQDLYAVLGVDRSASQEQIRRAFRIRSHMFHPDRFAAAPDTLREEMQQAGSDEFRKVTEAYDVLRDPQKRSLYDRSH